MQKTPGSDSKLMAVSLKHGYSENGEVPVPGTLPVHVRYSNHMLTKIADQSTIYV
jgi:hypothetical protein